MVQRSARLGSSKQTRTEHFSISEETQSSQSWWWESGPGLDGVGTPLAAVSCSLGLCLSIPTSYSTPDLSELTIPLTPWSPFPI